MFEDLRGSSFCHTVEQVKIHHPNVILWVFGTIIFKDNDQKFSLKNNLIPQILTDKCLYLLNQCCEEIALKYKHLQINFLYSNFHVSVTKF